jgi:multiple sugar transport system substrate-binding protein
MLVYILQQRGGITMNRSLWYDRLTAIGCKQTHERRPGFMAWIALGLAAMMILTGLAACGGSGSASSNGEVNLTYALWDQYEEVGYKQSIAEFMKQHPNIHVTIEQTPWAQYWQKLNTELVAGNAPDVFWDHLAYYPQFAQQGELMNLSPLIQQDKVDMSQYYPTLVKEWTYNGDVYGLPKDWDTICILYNKQIFQKAGLPAPNNLTWNPTDGGTFLQLMQKLTVDQNGKHPTDAGFDPKHINQYGTVSMNTGQEGYWNFIAMNGGTYLNKPFGQSYEFNQPASVQALQFLVDLINKYHVSPSAAETNNTSGVPEQLFEGGHAATIIAGSWELSSITQSANFPWGVVELPAGPKGIISVFNGLTDAIYAKTQHPKEAWELEKWLGSPQSEQIMGSGGYIWPGIQSDDQYFVQAWQKKNVDVSPYLKEAQGATVTFPISYGYNEASVKINDIFNQMYLGQLSVQQATNEAVQQGDQAEQSASTGS